ncbi:MAG: glycoside hydrolase family 16 protein [Myxococcota bacterium]
MRSVVVSSLIWAVLGIGCSDDDDDFIQAPPGFAQIFADEFNLPEGVSPDPAKWTYDIGIGENGWGNNEQQYYTDATDNVSMDGQGNLVITAREIPEELRTDFENRVYSSARIKTQGLFEHEYGIFEARIQLPSGQGMWPAFWMLGDDIDRVGWPRTGEIDIMEYNGALPDEVSAAVHGPGFNADASIFRKYRQPERDANGEALTAEDGDVVTVNFDEGFHTYTVQWDPAIITWFVDGDEFFRLSAEEVQATAAANCEDGSIEGGCAGFSRRDRWPFDHPFFMLLNVAVGGTFVQNQLPVEGQLPQSMKIDYVRVFERL